MRVNTVKQALTDKANTAIDEAQSNGKLTQEQADAAKARVPEAVDRFVTSTGPRGGHPFGKGHKGDDDTSSSGSSESTSS